MRDWETIPFTKTLAPRSTKRRGILAASSYETQGRFPVVDQGQELIAGWTNDESLAVTEDLPCIVFGDHTRVFKYVDFPFVPGADGTQLLKPSIDFNPRFFYFACLNLDIPNRGYNRHFTFLKEQTLRKPTKPEQEKIASVLLKVQKAIDVQERLLRIARELKNSAMRKLFTEGLRRRVQKETELGLLPETWGIAQLGASSIAISKGASPKWQGFEYTKSGVLFVRSQNVGDGRMIWSERAYLAPTWNQKEKRSILQTNDVLINLVGASIGRVAVGGEEIQGANCNQAVAFVRLKPDEIDPSFLAGFLLSDVGQQQIHRNKKDIARANLSLEDVRNITIPKPHLDEQREIGRVFRLINHKVALHEEKRTALQHLFKTLLNLFMTGQIQVDRLAVDTSDVVAC